MAPWHCCFLAVWGRAFVHGHAALAKIFTLGPEPLRGAHRVTGLAGDRAAHWGLLLAPRD